jgi:hypothetical protein
MRSAGTWRLATGLTKQASKNGRRIAEQSIQALNEQKAAVGALRIHGGRKRAFRP